MKRAIFAVMAFAAMVQSSPETERGGIGGCFELEPLCGIASSAVCLCDDLQRCRWVCR